MPVSMREMRAAGKVVGYAVVDDRGKEHGRFQVGRRVADRRVRNLGDARDRARAMVQAMNLEERRRRGG